ncbi:pectinesterase-like [Senna tora]|uniref:Pectinesterase n=1 Tax=Senna tora TaxID=362788 RepID=A0A834XA29_9FABA|nr:pectinesterase-like [Senna tora]
MASTQPLLPKPKSSISKTFLPTLSLIAIISSSALFASYLIKPKPTISFSNHICDHALHKPSCLAHVLEVTNGSVVLTTQDQKVHLLRSILMNSNSHIRKAMHTARAIKNRITNGPIMEQKALRECEKLLDLSIDNVFDSLVALTKNTTKSHQDAHTWLSSVLTNHFTCLDGLQGPARALMEPQLNGLISRARTTLAILVHTLPSNSNLNYNSIDEALSGEFPSWVSRKDRKVLEASSVKDIEVNVVVAKDGSGSYETLGEAVAAAPNKSSTRFIIYVKEGTYKENVEIGKEKKNIMIVGDGMDQTIITGNLSYMDQIPTSLTGTVIALGSGFIAQDIWFQNTAGPENHQAVALRVGGDLSVINRCRIDAFQDSLYAHTNRQFYRDCFITGTIDFIFGNAAVVLQKCNIVARRPMAHQKNMLTAQGRTDPNQNTGTSIQQCYITPSPDLEPATKTYLGRPWKAFSRTVVMQSLLDSHIDPAGWHPWDDNKTTLETLYYGEYMNYGLGAGTSGRVDWPGYHVITSADEARKFTVAELIQGDVWLKNTGVDYIEGL